MANNSWEENDTTIERREQSERRVSAPKSIKKDRSRELELELCDICRKINWHPILLDCCPDEQAKGRSTYRWADIPTFRQMEAQQHHCSFCRLCSAARRVRTSLQEPRLDDEALQLVYYVRRLKHGNHLQWSSKDYDDSIRRKNIKRMDAMGFRLFIIHAGFDLGTLHVNVQYAPDPIFQIMPAAEDVPPHRRKRSGQRVPASAADPTLFQRWLANCKVQHGTTCNAAYQETYDKSQWSQLFTQLGLQFRFRVIDVVKEKVIFAPRGCSYVALSYVWGNQPGNVRASKTHVKETADGESYLEIPSEGVPQTVRDAIRVTKMLGERFLWVDALCIVQDDLEELRETIGAMDVIYAAATLTIVAASGTDSSSGLSRAFPSSHRTEQPTEKVHGVTLFVEAESLYDRLAASCWRTRAWTFQEEYFSTRLLVFSEHHVYFRCKLHEKCEDIEIREDDGFQSYFLNSGPTSAIWMRARDERTNEMICVENKTSAHVEEQEQRSDSVDGASHSVVHVKKRQEPESLAHGSSLSSDWRATYRRWFEETKYWAGKKADLKCNIEPWFHSRWQQELQYWLDKHLYSEGYAPWFLPWSQSMNIRRRHSIDGFKYPHTEESKSTNRIWWIGRRRSIGSRPEAAGESQGSANLRLIVPEGSEPPFSRRNRTLSCIQPWMSSKASGSKIPQSASKLFKQYVKAVVEFTPRSLTKQSDALNAFQGILNHFGRLMGAEFVYGLPLAFFDDALLWKHVDDWLSDWFNPWDEYADSNPHRDYNMTKRSVFMYNTKGLKQYERRIKARKGKGCIRRYDIFEDCGGLPTWSWTGWQGAVGYYGSLSTESELKGKIIWPWKAEYTPPNIPMVTPQECVLQVEAWIAPIDLTRLQSLKFPDIFLGWPVEDGNRVRDGVVECILLSTDIKRQYGIHDGELIYNIMIVGRDSARGTLYRRGIAQLFPEDWEQFKPTKEWIGLR